MKIRQITETTAGATASGSVASVARPLGKMQERSNVAGLQPAEKVMKGKAKKKGPYTNSLLEGKMKDLAYDIQHMDNGNFLKKYGQPKDYFIKKLGNPPAIKEAEIVEADLIVVPGMRRMKDTSFIPHKADRRDHEVEMARSDLYAAAKDAMRIFKLLKGRSEDDGLMGWQQSYITLAADYLNSVADSIEYNAQMNEMLGGVLAGGMSNFEENSVNEISDFKKKEIEHELRNEPANNYAVHIDGRKWKVFKDKAHAEAVARKLRAKGKDVKVHLTGESPSVSEEQAPMFTPESKCPHCGGEMVSEDQLNEKKDACYYKVKARYKVWPSAYASGALVKCRKKGSKNWGKGKKK